MVNLPRAVNPMFRLFNLHEIVVKKTDEPEEAGPQAVKWSRSGCSRFPHSRVVTKMEKRMRIPPMVGVPCLPIWDLGPSVWMICPICMSCRRRITQGPRRKQIRNAVSPAVDGPEGNIPEDIQGAELVA